MKTPTAFLLLILTALSACGKTATIFTRTDGEAPSTYALQPTIAVQLASPQPFQVFQRNNNNESLVTLSGTAPLDSPDLNIYVNDTLKAVVRPSNGTLKAVLTLPAGGWYTIKVGSAVVTNVGVGEVFIIAGQSNSANYGSPRQAPQEDRVVAMHDTGWQRGADPQPLADGNGGSPWPKLGDLLVKALNVPVALVSVGVGGTHSGEWLPGGALYPRISKVISRLGLNGFRAILWHQGESDAQALVDTATYVSNLKAIIAQSRLDAGFNVPWVVASASYLPLNTPTAMQAIRDAQGQLWASNEALQGPETDSLGPTYRQADGAHFNQSGLDAHAAKWYTSLVLNFFQ